jgi:NAD(P)-dependent dehydrogenase (short-subunit alcohol dehydrogenase family)
MTSPAAGPLPEWLDLRGTVALVTGGGTHLGYAMSAALGELGASVHIVGRRAEVVNAAAEQLRQSGVEAMAHAADAADERAIGEVIDTVMSTHGCLDTLVCSAGGATGLDAVPNVTVADLEETFRQNVTTTMVCAQAAARVMIPRRAGSIITIGSIHGSLGSDVRLYDPAYPRSHPPYHAAKGAVVNLTRALACELAQHAVTVNCISPGQIPRSKANKVTLENFRRSIPLGRLGTPADLRGAVALFASDAGRWITGQNLVVDGGWSAW